MRMLQRETIFILIVTLNFGVESKGSTTVVPLVSPDPTRNYQTTSPGVILPGEVRLFTGKLPLPQPWLLCDGSAVCRERYQILFRALGEKYGAGDGKTTFNLPRCKNAHLIVDKIVGQNNETAPEAAAVFVVYSGLPLSNDFQNSLEKELKDLRDELQEIREILNITKRENGNQEMDGTNTLQSRPQTTASTRKSNWTPEEISRFKYDNVSPIKANDAGEYESFSWQNENGLRVWSQILGEPLHAYTNNRLYLPPLLLNEDLIDKATAILIHGRRYKNEFRIFGWFHYLVPQSTSPLNVQLEMTVTFTMKNNTKITVSKQIVATIEHKIDSWLHNRLITFYHIPYDSLSLSIVPVATNIAIRKLSLEQQWMYWGLAPSLGSKEGKFATIDCKSIHGAFDCPIEWKQLADPADIGHGALILPPLRIVNNVTLCFFGWRSMTGMDFHAKFHWTTPANVNSNHTFIFKLDFNATMKDNSIVQRQSKNNNVTLHRDWTWNIMSFKFQFNNVSLSVAPRINVSIMPAK